MSFGRQRAGGREHSVTRFRCRLNSSLFSGLRPPSSVLGLLSSVLFLFHLTSVAQNDDPFITVSAPAQSGKSVGTAAVAGAQDVFITVSAPEAKKAEAPVVSVKPASTSVASSAAEPTPQPASEQKNNEIWERELLRDPFWPVGFFPEGWQKKSTKNDANMDGQDWKVAASKISIDGTSRMGDKTLAIINGELKNVGDLVVVVYKGKSYQWKIFGIDSSGKVQLKKQETR
jgi:hypothetical protein